MRRILAKLPAGDIMTQEYRYDATPNVQQGTIFALGALPVGVVAYVVLYQFGFVASVVAFGTAWLAALLYQYGSGRPMDRTGAVRVAVITLSTIVISIAGGIIWDVAGFWAGEQGTTTFAVLFTSDFWDYLVYDLSDWDYFSPYIPDILIGLVFGIIGCFSTLRAAFGRGRHLRRERDGAATTPPSAPGRYGAMLDDDEPAGR